MVIVFDTMHEELEPLKENNVFESTNLSEGKKTVRSKWVYSTKENPDGPKRYKARFVARGFSQKGYRLWRNLLPYSKHHINTHLDADGGAI